MRIRIKPLQMLFAVLLTWAIILNPSVARAEHSACEGDTQGSGTFNYSNTFEGAVSGCSAAAGIDCTNNTVFAYTYPNGAPAGWMYCSALGFGTNRSHRWAFPLDPANLCPVGDTIDPLTGMCTLDSDSPPQECAIDEMTFRNEYGEVTSCVASIDPDLDSCDNVQGYIDNTLLCADNLDQCNAAGGDFGYFNGEPMCLQPEIPPSGDYCPSGYVVVYGAGIDGAAGSFTCVLPENLPPTICDGSQYDCDGDGNVDDQNGNGLIDNGISDSTTGYQGAAGAAGAAGADGVNVGYDDLNPAAEGAGDCDPTSKNYARCAGFLEDEELPEDARGERSDLSSGDSMDQVAGNIYTRLGNAPIVQMIGNVGQVFSFSNEACPTPSFEAFGKMFSIDFHCQLYLDIAGILSAIMMIVFSIAGIRHIASA